MRYFSKIVLFVTSSSLLLSCSQSVATLATSSPTPTETAISTLTTTPTITFTPTTIPTINPTDLSRLLQSAFKVETLVGMNGHRLRSITGWSNGFNKDYWWVDNFQGYQWMDSNHILLFPIVGKVQSPNWSTTLDRAVVLNIETGAIWLPPSDLSDPGYRVLRFLLPRWSPEAKVLITAENIGNGNNTKEGVTTFKSDGTFVAHYDGRLTSVSPSGNKILIADDTWVDLNNDKKIEFNWDGGTYTPRWRPIWSLDENQIYFCCFFYGNAITGESYYLPNEDTIFEGKPIDFEKSLHHSHGIWLNDNHVLAQADGFYTFMSYFEGMIPVFDIQAKTYRDLIKLANLPYDPSNIVAHYAEKNISPKGDYIWIHIPTAPTGFLVDLKTFRSWEYPRYFQWSTNGEYAVILIENSKFEIVDSKLLVLSSKELKAMPSDIQCNNWHPTKGVCLSLTANEQGTSTLNFLNVQDMSVQKTALSTPLFNQAIWSPKGDYVIFVTEDKALWKIDYPSLENMEQLTRPLADMYIESIIWSPDYEHLSFVGGATIYIVDINKSQ